MLCLLRFSELEVVDKSRNIEACNVVIKQVACLHMSLSFVLNFFFFFHANITFYYDNSFSGHYLN